MDFMDSYHNGFAPVSDGDAEGHFFLLMEKAKVSASMPNPMCDNVAWESTKAGATFYITHKSGTAGDWTAYLDDSNSKIIYSVGGAGQTFNCALTTCTIASGKCYFMAYNIDPGFHWLVLKQESKLFGYVFYMGASSWSYIGTYVE